MRGRRRLRARTSEQAVAAMTIVNRLSVGAKLSASFAVVVALLVAVSVTGFWALRGLSAAHHDVTDDVIPLLVAADGVRADAADMHFSQTHYVVEPDSYDDFAADRKVYRADLAK